MAEQTKSIQHLDALVTALVEQCAAAGVSLPGIEETRLKTIDMFKKGPAQVLTSEFVRELSAPELRAVINLTAVALGMDTLKGRLRSEGVTRFSEIPEGMFYKLIGESLSIYQQCFVDCFHAEYGPRSGVMLGVQAGRLCVVRYEEIDEAEARDILAGRLADAVMEKLRERGVTEAEEEVPEEIDPMLKQTAPDPSSGKLQ